MPKAGEIAIELRRIAETLDREPELELRRPEIWFWHSSDKESFLRLMRVFPRPLTKEYETGSYPDLIVTHATRALHLTARISRAAVCVIKEPARDAVYDCIPLLSEIEEAQIA